MSGVDEWGSMSDRDAPDRALVQAARGGLCATCRHVRTVTSAKGSTFVLCGLAKEGDAAGRRAFSKYPPQPVLVCRGHER